MPRHNVPLPAYPEILLQPWRNDHTQAEVDEIFGALCKHYELEGPPGLRGERTLSNELWAKLALKLLRDFVPAFREPKRPGRPVSNEYSPDEAKAYRDAGGDGGNWMVEPYIQACFVLQVRKLQNETGSLTGAFKMLAGRGHRSELPRRYQQLRSISSLKDAWKAIPAWVRDHPDGCIPQSKPIADPNPQ